MMSKKKAEDWREQDLDVVYQVRIRTDGTPARHIDQIGQSLARLMEWNFTNSEVRRGKTVYSRPTWEPFEKVDSTTHTDVV